MFTGSGKGESLFYTPNPWITRTLLPASVSLHSLDPDFSPCRGVWSVTSYQSVWDGRLVKTTPQISRSLPSWNEELQKLINFFFFLAQNHLAASQGILGSCRIQVYKPPEQGIASGWCLKSVLLNQTVSQLTGLYRSFPQPCRNQLPTGKD